MAGTFNKVMSKFYSRQDSVEEAVEHLRPHRWIMGQLYLRQLDIEDDWRTGDETYGYKSDEAILGDLLYISDRWRAAFRIKWMIDLIDRYDKVGE